MQKSRKHEPTHSYFYLAIHSDKFMMRDNYFNLHVDPVRMERTGTQYIPISHICDLKKIKSKGILAEKNLLQVSSTKKSES